MSSVWDWTGPVAKLPPPKRGRPTGRKSTPRPKAQPIENPWGLTPPLAEALIHLAEYDSFKAASKATGIGYRAYESRATRIRQKTGLGVVQAAVKFALWRQGEGMEVAA